MQTWVGFRKMYTVRITIPVKFFFSRLKYYWQNRLVDKVSKLQSAYISLFLKKNKTISLDSPATWLPLGLVTLITGGIIAICPLAEMRAVPCGDTVFSSVLHDVRHFLQDK